MINDLSLLTNHFIMADEVFLVIGIVGAWFLSSLISVYIRYRRNELPTGSITLEIQEDEEERKVPSPGWAKIGVILAMGGNISTQIAFIILVIFGFWDEVVISIGVGLPSWLNWFGLVGIWAHLALGISVMYYNVNYTPLFQAIPTKYTLATGGPYRFVRHPQYLSHVMLTLFGFFTTGLWIMLITSIGWIGLPMQMTAEEKFLTQKFGQTYLDYSEKTGRIFPRIL